MEFRGVDALKAYGKLAIAAEYRLNGAADDAGPVEDAYHSLPAAIAFPQTETVVCDSHWKRVCIGCPMGP